LKRVTVKVLLLLGLAGLAGCAMSPEERMSRELSLKQTMDSFVAATVQGDWNTLYGFTDGDFESADQLKENLAKSWVQDATLTNGSIASMAWVNDRLAKVKLNWTFQSGSVQSFSSETFVWVWRGNGWKYKGRTLR